MIIYLIYLAYVIQIVSLIFCLLTYIIIIKPWKLIWALKQIHGQDIYIYFYPLIGAYRLPYSRKQVVAADPYCKAIVSNHWTQLNFTILRPECIKDLLVTNQQHYEKYLPIFMITELNQSLLLTEGIKWKHQKSMIKILNFDTLKYYTLHLVQNSILRNFEDIKDNFIGEEEYSVVEISDWGRKIQSDIAIQQFFCDKIKTKMLDGECIVNQISHFVEELFLYSFGSPLYLLKYMLIKTRVNDWQIFQSKKEKQLYQKAKKVKQLIREVVEERTEEIKQNKLLFNSFNLMDNLIMDHLKQQELNKEEYQKIPKHKIIDLNEVVEQSMGMYIAALDNAGVFLGNIMFCLASYVQTAKLIKEEIAQVFPEDLKIEKNTISELNKQEFIQYKQKQQQSSSQDKDLNNNENENKTDFTELNNAGGLIEKLNQLENTTLFIKESLRIFNSSPGMFPRISTGANSLGGIDVPKDSIVHVSWNTVTTNRTIYNNPYVFDIKRFETSGIQSQVHTPFSAGRRSCIGENMSMYEIKIMMVLFIQNFEFKRNPAVVPSFQQMGLTTNPVNDKLVMIKPKYKQQQQ